MWKHHENHHDKSHETKIILKRNSSKKHSFFYLFEISFWINESLWCGTFFSRCWNIHLNFLLNILAMLESAVSVHCYDDFWQLPSVGRNLASCVSLYSKDEWALLIVCDCSHFMCVWHSFSFVAIRGWTKYCDISANNYHYSRNNDSNIRIQHCLHIKSMIWSWYFAIQIDCMCFIRL